jgi:short-subunit dehydrogenase
MNSKISLLPKTIGWAATGVGAFLLMNALYNELNRYDLRGKVVLITGSSRGLGLVLARALAAKGAKLAICSRSADKVELARQELERAGATVIGMPIDLTDERQVKTLVSDVTKHYGKLDVLINNAGIIQVGPAENMTVKDYEEAMQTNFFAPLYAIQAVVPHFKKRGEGRIVNITSIGGIIAVPHLLPYTASKFAFVGLSEGLHAELKKSNIHVTTVVPNLMRTGSARNIDVKGNHESEYAWFKTAASLPLLSEDPEVSAKNIITALEYGKREVVFSLSGKLASVIRGIAPGWLGLAMNIANRLLPEPVYDNVETKKGYEAESSKSTGKIGQKSDVAAIRNNEM